MTKKTLGSQQSKRLPYKVKKKKNTSDHLWSRISKFSVILIGLFVFAIIGYLLFKYSGASSTVDYQTGVVMGVDGKVFNTTTFARSTNPQLFVSQCKTDVNCYFSVYMVPPKEIDENAWTEYLITSSNGLYSRTVSNDASINVNEAYDVLNVDTLTIQKETIKVRFHGPKGYSDYSNTVYVPAYVKPVTTSTTTTTTTTTSPNTTTIPSNSNPSTTPSTNDTNSDSLTNDISDLSDDSSLSLSDLTDMLNLSDLSSLNLSDLLSSDPSLLSLSSELTSNGLSATAVNTSDLSNSSVISSLTNLSSQANSSSGDTESLTNLGYRMILFCVNQLPKNYQTFTVVDCNNAKNLFLGITGPDQSIKKNKLTYHLSINNSKIKFDSFNGCQLKKLDFNNQMVSWCAIIYGQKSIIQATKDNVQGQINKALVKIGIDNLQYKYNARMYNFNSSKTSLDADTYTVTASYLSNQPITNSGSVRFSVKASAVGGLLQAAQSLDCKKGGGTFTTSNDSCSKAPASSQLLSNSTSYQSSDSSKTKSDYYYDNPSQVMLQNLIGILANPDCFLNGACD